MVSECHYKAALQHALKRSGFIHDHVKYEECIRNLVKKYFDKSKQWCQQLDRRQQFWDELSKTYPERANNVAIQERSLAYARAVLTSYRRGLRRRKSCTTPSTSNVTQRHQIPTERNLIPEPEVTEANLHNQLDNDDDPGSYNIGGRPFDLNKRPMIFTFGSPTIEIPDEPELQNDAQKVPPPGTLFTISRVAQHLVRSLSNDARGCEEAEPTCPLSQLTREHGSDGGSSPTLGTGSPTTADDYPVHPSTSLSPPTPLNTTNPNSDPVTVLSPPTTQPATPTPNANNTASTSSPHRTDGQGPGSLNEDYTVEEVRTFLSACIPPMTHHLSTFIRAGIKGNEYLKAIAGLSESGTEALWSSLGPSVSRLDLEILRSYLLSWKSSVKDTCRY